MVAATDSPLNFLEYNTRPYMLTDSPLNFLECNTRPDMLTCHASLVRPSFWMGNCHWDGRKNDHLDNFTLFWPFRQFWTGTIVQKDVQYRTKSYRDYLQNRTHMMLHNWPSQSIRREKLACLNNLRSVQLGTLAKHVVRPGFEPRPPQASCMFYCSTLYPFP